MCICVYVCICAYVCIYIYVCMCVYVYRPVNVYMSVYVYVCVCVCLRVSVYVCFITMNIVVPYNVRCAYQVALFMTTGKHGTIVDRGCAGNGYSEAENALI